MISLYPNCHVYDVFVTLKALHKLIFRISVIEILCSEYGK